MRISIQLESIWTLIRELNSRALSLQHGLIFTCGDLTQKIASLSHYMHEFLAYISLIARFTDRFMIVAHGLFS